MTLVLMQKSACNASYPNMHIVREVPSVIIKPVQPTYHDITIHMPASMITHETRLKVNADITTWRVKWVGGGKT